ncbi:MAG: hypothetical protein Q9227_006326 [Pyrenula ochraceoflavens]
MDSMYDGPTTYISTAVVTATQSGTTSTTTSALEYIYATASASSSNDAIGDGAVLFSAQLRGDLENLAVKHCSASGKRRDVGDFASCAMNYLKEAVDHPAFKNVPDGLPMITAGDVGAVIKAFTSKEAIEFVGGVVLLTVALRAWFNNNGESMPQEAKIPKEDMGSPSQTTTSESCSVTSTTSSTTIPANCGDSSLCAGNASGTCMTGKYKSCSCEFPSIPTAHPNWMDLDAQQNFLTYIEADIPDPGTVTATSTSTASVPSYTSSQFCMGAGWKVQAEAVKSLISAFCSSLGDSKTFDQDNQLSTCSYLVNNPDTPQGNVNDPPLGNAFTVRLAVDPGHDGCTDVPLNSIKFNSVDCVTAIGKAVDGCPVGTDPDTAGGSVSINCAQYGVIAVDKLQVASYCPNK